MNIGLLILVVLVAWSVVSIVVALTVGGMAQARDTGPTGLIDHRPGAGRVTAVHDDDVRAAV